MNFTPFTGHIPTAAAIPSIQQFAAKFGYESSGGVVQETRYQTSSAGNNGGGGAAGVQFAVTSSAPDTKYRHHDAVVVVSAAPPTAAAVALAGIAPIHTVNTGVKYQTISASSSVNLGNITYGGQTSYLQTDMQHIKENRTDKREYREEIQHDLMATMMQQQVTQATPLQQGQQLLVVLHEPKEAAALARAIKQENRQDRTTGATTNEYIIVSGGVGVGMDGVTEGWGVSNSGNAMVADYLSALPLPLHHLLKYTTADKRDEHTVLTLANTVPNIATIVTSDQTQVQNANAPNTVLVQAATVVSPPSATTAISVTPKKRKKKKTTKEKKPRPKPGEIRLTTALDGSTLYCCPECHMAYPERGLLEQHLVGHTMERRFICDICNAALKRKDHLTRHKQSHNPERPHVCSVCLKAFKRKEQLTLHFVIHSGEKRHVCNECGKGFYRKDHLRKHTRSHIARRVKAEMSAGANTSASQSASASASHSAATDC